MGINNERGIWGRYYTFFTKVLVRCLVGMVVLSLPSQGQMVPTSFQSEMFSFYIQLTVFYFFLTDHWTSTSKSLKRKSENKQTFNEEIWARQTCLTGEIDSIAISTLTRFPLVVNKCNYGNVLHHWEKLGYYPLKITFFYIKTDLRKESNTSRSSKCVKIGHTEDGLLLQFTKKTHEE